MPYVDDSLSWGYVIVNYTTFAAQHKFKLHVSHLNVDFSWGAPRTGAFPEVYLLDTLDDYVSLLSFAFPSGTTFGLVEVFQNQLGDQPATPFGTQMMPTPSAAPSAGQTAGAMRQFVFKTGGGQRANFIVADAWTGAPQRYAFAGLNAGATAFVDYILNGLQIVSVDGGILTAFQSLTSGLNRRNVRKYGRFITP